MKTEQALQMGTIGRQARNQQGQGGTTMQATVTRTWQSRKGSMILALLIIGALLLEGLVMWNNRSSVGSDAAVPRASVANEGSGDHWVPPQAQAYLPRAVPPVAGEVTAADFPPQAQAYLPRTMPGLTAERTPADFPPQAQAYLPQSIHDAGKATAGCEANSFPPQAQAYLPCQRRGR